MNDLNFEVELEYDEFYEHHKRFYFYKRDRSWISILVLILSFMIGMLTSLATINEVGMWGKYNSLSYISHILAYSPLVAIIIFVGFPPALRDLHNLLIRISPRKLPIFIGSFIAACWLINSSIMGKIYPLQFVYMLFYAISILSILKYEMKRGEKSAVSWEIVLIILSVFVPINLRWIYVNIYFGPQELNLIFLSAFYTAILVVGIIWMRRFEKIYYCFIPTWKDIVMSLLTVIVFGGTFSAIGYLTHQLQYHHPSNLSFINVASTFLTNLFTTVILQEIIFRGLLYSGLERILKSKVSAVLTSSFFFGLIHWIRETQVVDSLVYSVFGLFAGISYSICYILADNSILASSLAHCTINTIWQYTFNQ